MNDSCHTCVLTGDSIETKRELHIAISIKIKIKNTKGSRAATIIIFMVVAFSLILVVIAATSVLRGKEIAKEAINAQVSSIKSNIPVITFAEETEVPVFVAFNETAQTINYSVI